MSVKVLNKEKLLVIIEDEQNNKFGGYLNVKVDGTSKYISDSNAFIFSLKSNERINGMKKFNISNSSYAFYIWPKTNNGRLQTKVDETKALTTSLLIIIVLKIVNVSFGEN